MTYIGFRIPFLAALFAAALLTLCPAATFAAPGAEIPAARDLQDALRKLLKDHPEIVMEVLKENSETVLEIAQEGQILRNRKIMRAQWDADAKVSKRPNLEGRAALGPANAPVTIVAYSDYQCGYCRQAESTLQGILKKYQGKIRIYNKATPNQENEIAVAAAAYATAAFMQDADKGRKFHDLLFEEANRVHKDGESVVKELAAKAGLDLKRLTADVSSAKVQKQMDADDAEAQSFGIRGTPYFLVNNLLIRGSIAPEMFEEAVERALAEKGKK